VDQQPVNILLVDDRVPNLVALEAMLDPLGQNVVQARSGREALKWLLTHDAAVILLDVAMPEMDGFETAALIRERDRSRHVPIIFLTAAAQYQTEAVRGYALGAVDYLLKPVVPEFVRSKVTVFVELAKQRAQLARQAELLRIGEQAARELAEARAGLVRDLQFKNRELESFSYAVSHDLRAPLRRIDGFARALEEHQAGRLDAKGSRHLARIQESTAQMLHLIDDVLHLSRVTCAEMRLRELDLSAVAHAVAEHLRQDDPGRAVEWRIRPAVRVTGDPALLRIVLENLFANAWKFTAKG
jgi:CheY-like chemotaxis protein